MPQGNDTLKKSLRTLG